MTASSLDYYVSVEVDAEPNPEHLNAAEGPLDHTKFLTKMTDLPYACRRANVLPSSSMINVVYCGLMRILLPVAGDVSSSPSSWRSAIVPDLQGRKYRLVKL